jgi:predicted ATP-grasp superfamily ATP-dependent carboligase
MTNGKHVSTPVTILRAVAHGPLGIVRSLGRLGVPVYVVDPDPRTPARFSRYCRRGFVRALDPPEAAVHSLLEVARAIGTRSILIPTTDDAALLVADHADALAEGFVIVDLPRGLARALCSKKEMHELARRHGVPTAETVFPQSREDVLQFLARATFPLMLKGIDGLRLQRRAGARMFIVRDREELLRRYDAFEEPGEPNLMLQEYIPGGDDTVWMFNGYFDAGSECVFGITGKKIRQHPVSRGATTLGICLHNETVAELTRRFMKALGYRGILDIGYRYDARDGLYKVLDVNPRIGATFRLFVADNGMDVARALYLDRTGQRVEPGVVSEGRKWLVEDFDLASSYRYRRDGRLTIGQWMRSLSGVRETAYLSLDDPVPLLPLCASDTGKVLRWLSRRARGAVRDS